MGYPGPELENIQRDRVGVVRGLIRAMRVFRGEAAADMQYELFSLYFGWGPLLNPSMTIGNRGGNVSNRGRDHSSLWFRGKVKFCEIQAKIS